MAVKCFGFLILLICVTICAGYLCPKECDCDTDKGLNRATCVDQNIISVDVGVPKGVQIYSLSHNAISELTSRCFKDAGYLSINILDLSYNHISWIGLNAFSGLDKLFHLDLSNNYLRSISPDLFRDTPMLDTLDLSANVFETLRNERLINHGNLKVLNLNNCRIRTLPTRIFNGLPNLRKLDLSDNYMVSLDTNALAPLRKLQRLELRNDYWQCSAEFKGVENWITSRGITYEKICKDLNPKMSERMIALPTIERKQVDVSEIWNETNTNATVLESPKKSLTPFEKFDEEFSAFQAFIIGMEIGLAIGIVGTYIWLSRFCSCGRLRCRRTPSRQRRRRVPREGDMRTNLLWSNVIQPDADTPPLNRRQLSPERSQGQNGTRVVESALQVDAIRGPNRPETPPPPYNECRINL